MIKTTLSKLKKACSSLMLTPRVLRGDSRYAPGKLQKNLSITVLRRAEKSTKSGKDKESECDKCKKLIELIFEPNKQPDAIRSTKKTELSEADNQHIYSEEVYRKGIRENAIPSADFQLNATTAKQTDDKLTQNIEVSNEAPRDVFEKSLIEGPNISPKVLVNVADVQSVNQLDNQKPDTIEDISIQSTYNFETRRFDEDYEATDSVEDLVRRIEETRRLEELVRLEEIRRVEILLSNEMERSDFKLPLYNFASARQNRKFGTPEVNIPYDELATRCLDAPNSKIDERLLKEMEKLGVSSSPRREDSIIEENIMQMEDLRNPDKSVEKIDLNTREFERDPPIAYIDKQQEDDKMANNPTAITDDEADNRPIVQMQLYIIDKPYNQDNMSTTEQPLQIDAQEEGIDFEPRPSYDPTQAIIDPYDKRNIVFEKDEDQNYDPLWYEKFTFPQDVQESEINNSTATQLLAADKAINASSQSQPIPTPESQNEPEPYIAFDSIEKKKEKWQFSDEPEPDAFQTKNEDYPEERAGETLPFSNLNETQSNSESDPADAKETIKLSFEIDPDFNPEPAVPIEANTPKHPKETFHFITRPEPTSVKNNAVESFTHENANESYQFLVQPEPTTKTETNKAKVNSEQFAFVTQPEQTTTKGEIELQRTAPLVSVKPSEVTRIETPDVTYSEKSLPEPARTETENPPAEQVSHSFAKPETTADPLVQSQTLAKPSEDTQKPMADPLVQSQTLAKPSEDIQKAMSASCAMPKLKPIEELSLSEMLKRVRMRNKMEYCHVYDRQLVPAPGKCGKKPPQCPPDKKPPCPPSSPTCPKSCKTTCSSQSPKNTCQKFKRYFPGISFKNIITLLLQPETKQKSSLFIICNQITKRSRVGSHSLEEVGLNLIANPRKI